MKVLDEAALVTDLEALPSACEDKEEKKWSQQNPPQTDVLQHGKVFCGNKKTMAKMSSNFFTWSQFN